VSLTYQKSRLLEIGVYAESEILGGVGFFLSQPHLACSEESHMFVKIKQNVRANVPKGTPRQL